MKRWVWLGLVGGLVACSDKEPPSVEPQECPGTEEVSLPNLPTFVQAQREEVEEVLVTFRPRVSASAAANASFFANEVVRAGAQVKRRLPHLNMVSARVTPEAREALARNPEVLSVRLNPVVRAMGLRPSVGAFLGAVNTAGSVGEYTEGLKMVQAPDVWDANPRDGILDANAPIGAGIKVCVVDSGWDSRHPELAAAYVGGKDFVDNDDEPLDQRKDSKGNITWGGGHGTHVAGTIVAQLGAGAHVRPGEEVNGVVGVAPGASLLVARVLDTQGNGRTDDVLAALQWCREQGAHIASLSLGSPDQAEGEEAAYQAAEAAGMLVIAASGNDGTAKLAYPGAFDSVLAVGSVGANREWSEFSQYSEREGKSVLMGPGENVLSSFIVGASPYSDVDVQGTRFASEPLEYSGIGKYTGRLVNCGLGDSITSCGQGATCDGFVAYVDRGGGIYFEEKARNAIRAGARAVIIGNNVAEDGAGRFTLTTPASYWVPTTSVSLASANSIKGLIGQEVTVDVTGLDYARETGTSMATPHVSGVAALVWSSCPRLTAAQVRQALTESAVDLPPAGRDAKTGYGLVQAVDAIRAASALCPTAQP